jgi:hypothetical protein
MLRYKCFYARLNGRHRKMKQDVFKQEDPPYTPQLGALELELAQ